MSADWLWPVVGSKKRRRSQVRDLLDEILNEEKRMKIDLPSTPKIVDGKLQFSLPVDSFQPEDLTVKITDDDQLIIEAKHEDKSDSGYSRREVFHSFAIPSNVDKEKIQSKLNSQGVLIIEAPVLKPQIEDKPRETVIPITRVSGKEASEEKQK